MKINYTVKPIVTPNNVQKGKTVRIREVPIPDTISTIRQRLREHYDHVITSVGTIETTKSDVVQVSFQLENGDQGRANFCIGYLDCYELEYIDQ